MKPEPLVLPFLHCSADRVEAEGDLDRAECSLGGLAHDHSAHATDVGRDDRTVLPVRAGGEPRGGRSIGVRC